MVAFVSYRTLPPTLASYNFYCENMFVFFDVCLPFFILFSLTYIFN